MYTSIPEESRSKGNDYFPPVSGFASYIFIVTFHNDSNLRNAISM